MYKRKMISMLMLLGVSSIANAASITVVNNSAVPRNGYFRAATIGLPRSMPKVADMSGAWGVRQLDAGLPSDKQGKYRIKEVRFCIGSYDNCIDEDIGSKNFKKCSLTDYTTRSVNEENAKVIVNLYNSTTCTAIVRR